MQIVENKKELTLSDGINYLDKINKYNKTSSDNIEKRFNDFLPYFSMYCEFVADCKKIARNKHKEKKLSPKTLEKVMNEKQKIHIQYIKQFILLKRLQLITLQKIQKFLLI